MSFVLLVDGGSFIIQKKRNLYDESLRLPRRQRLWLVYDCATTYLVSPLSIQQSSGNRHQTCVLSIKNVISFTFSIFRTGVALRLSIEACRCSRYSSSINVSYTCQRTHVVQALCTSLG